MSTKLKNIRVEFHIIQSFPVTCLNRDDVGAPKSAIVGGVKRARVSSQCWKRQVRLEMENFGIKLGLRTKRLEYLVSKACLKLNATEEQAEACGFKIATELSSETLLFISDTEANALAKLAQLNDFDEKKLKAKDIAKCAKKAFNPAFDALDIALFGRMVAKAADMNIEAAASFSHAISTHQVNNEIEFFTALDDVSSSDSQGSGHMGSLEFNSATYYRYISLDLGQLAQTFGNDEMEVEPEQIHVAIEAFTKALFVAVPTARQNSQSGASPWEFAKVLVRKGQRLQVPFDSPVNPEQHGHTQPSITRLKTYLEKKEKMSGSLFGKLGDYEWGADEEYSVDSLIADLQSHVE